MLNIRSIPLKYRLPLIHGGILGLARLKSGAWRKASDSDTPISGPLLVSGFLTESSGIARGGHLSLKGFQVAGYTPVVHDLRPGFRHFIDGKARLPEIADGGVWYIHANSPEVMVALLAHSPDQWASRYRIAYWAWETPKAPDYWVWTADYLHEIWVPSVFVRDGVARAFEAANRPDLTPRLRVMPHPMFDVNQARPDRTRFGLSHDRVEFLCLFDAKSSSARKNPWAVLDAWLKAFPVSSDNARLTLKVQDLSRDPDIAARLDTYMSGRDDIRFFTERLSDTDINNFMASFDALISLHRAEGFGLTLAEAMTLGVSVIATGWSGNVDFMDDNSAYMIPSQLIDIKDPTGTYEPFRPFWIARDREQIWADPDVSAAAEAILSVTNDPELRTRKAAAAKARITAVNDAWTAKALGSLPFNDWLSRKS
ncbi:glycosyltransferase [Asticcacaulis machinosus]|uniref:Glycosyltransferase n=1 Tax=Asticcacaulis machinosus TaxID=2984211 RepID=A0ABT5HKA3_9CAUL|nr:glycosyltransferase [Asticcacaulis machinosus]MDC7676680.1 glycosyltransferase [Asticcacaulis machinosus]